MIPTIESVKDPQIGKFYMVRCGVFRSLSYPDHEWWGDDIDMPIMGDWHHDRDVVGFEDYHYHIDWRFVGARHLHSAIQSANRSVMGIVLTRKMIVEQPRRVAKAYKRTMPDYPQAPWLPVLRSEYKNHNALKKNCLICPHRKFNLTSITPENGVVECPGHGLRWDAKTGALAS